MKDSVRFGIVGMGTIGQLHARNLIESRAGRSHLAAVATTRELDLPESVRRFESLDEMLTSGAVDAVVVATPHPTHKLLSEKVLRAGCHLLLEKPIASRIDEARELVDAACAQDRLFGVMHQMRVDPLYVCLRECFQRGDWGALLRFAWTATDWYRPDAYYKAVDWRATWAGEGGGLLVNQCPHDLDLISWIFGLPGEARAFVDFGKHHPIETEDEVHAVMFYPNGRRGTFTASTGEAPGLRRIEIACEKALVVVEGRKLTIQKLESPVGEFSRGSNGIFSKPEHTAEVLEFKPVETPHARIMADFAEAVLEGKPLLAPGKEGLASVELANAFVLSTWENAAIKLPLDAERYGARLDEKIRASTRGPARS
jgi:predicted dehydrogenase